MNREPTLHDVVDVLTARLEAATDPVEQEVLRYALASIEAYVFSAGSAIELAALQLLWATCEYDMEAVA